MSENAIKLMTFAIQAGFPTEYNQNPEPIPCLVIAEPGVGKTAIITQIGVVLSRAIGRTLPTEVIAAPQASPEQIGGLPYPEDGVTNLWPMGAAKRLIKAGAGILVIDEGTSGSEQTAAACLTLVQSGRAGDATLPSSVARIMMGNHPDNATNGRSFTPAESNRFCWLKWDLSYPDWKDYRKGGLGALRHITSDLVLHPSWEENYAPLADSYIFRYLERNPMAFHKAPANHDCNKAWPSQRSWTRASRMVAACLSAGYRITSDIVRDAVCGNVGEDVGMPFFQFIVETDLIDPEEALKEDSDFKFSKSIVADMVADRFYVTVQSLCHSAIRKGPFPHIEAKYSSNSKELANAMAAERRRRWLRCAELLGQITDSGVAQSSIAVTEGCPILATSPVMGEVIGSMDASTKKLLKRYSEINKALNISEILR